MPEISPSGYFWPTQVSLQPHESFLVSCILYLLSGKVAIIVEIPAPL